MPSRQGSFVCSPSRITSRHISRFVAVLLPLVVSTAHNQVRHALSVTATACYTLGSSKAVGWAERGGREVWNRGGVAAEGGTNSSGGDDEMLQLKWGGATPLPYGVSEQDHPANGALQIAINLYRNREAEAAIHHLHVAIDRNANCSLAWMYLGVVLEDLNREDEAVVAYQAVQALPDAPATDVANAFCNHGNIVHENAGADYARVEEGISLFRRGLERVPDQPNCLYNLGLGMEKAGQYEEARSLFLRALENDPSNGKAQLGLGNVAFRSREWTEGIYRYESAYSTPGADQELRKLSSFMLAQLYRHGLEQFSKSLEFYKRSWAIDPGYTEALCCIVQTLRSLCLWEGWDSLEPRVASLIAEDVAHGREPGPQNPYTTRLTGELTPSQHLGLAQLASRSFDRVVRLPLELHDEGRAEQRRLVVAYWSYDFRAHPMGHLTRGLFCTHRVIGRVFAVAASYGPHDGSFVRQSAGMCAETFLDLFRMGDVETATAVAAAKPDIFVDLMGHTTGARHGIPALKPAPIVASYLGYPGTTGAEYTDYTIADSTVVPPELAVVGFSEKLVYLPHTYQANDYDFTHTFCGGRENLRQCQASVRISRGLHKFLGDWGGEGPVLCNYNAIHKMEPESFTVFMDILRRIPGSVLLLLSYPVPSPEVEANLRAEAAARGIHPDRIRMDDCLDRAEHLWRMSGSCDLFVDSFLYGAHTTAADALWAGLPLITLRGYGVDETPVGKMSGRVGTSLLSALGLPELSFHSVKDLEDAAVQLASSKDGLSSLRKRLLSATMKSPLFDTRLITRNLERAYEAMWELKEMGVPPSHIVVDPTQSSLRSRQQTHRYSEFVNEIPPSIRQQTPKREQKQQPEVGYDHSSKKDMVLRATEALVGWMQAGTREGAEAAFAATARVLAAAATDGHHPFNTDALHYRGLALHLLGRREEAAVLLERAALLVTGGWKGSSAQIGATVLWKNLEVVQIAAVEASDQSGPPPPVVLPYRKGLALRPTEPTLLHLLLRGYLRQGSYVACADAFWEYWPGLRGYSARGDNDKDFGDGWAWEPWEGTRDFHPVVGIMKVVATCFAGCGRLEQAWRAWKAAAELDPDNQEYLLRYAACLENAGHVEEADSAFSLVVRRLNEEWFQLKGGSNVTKLPRPRGNADKPSPIVIAIYCHEYGNAWFPNWGPSSLGNGLGGSEEAVIHVSRELAGLGYWVEVYADPAAGDIGLDDVGPRTGARAVGAVGEGGRVVWYPCTAYDISYPPDVFVAWRYHVSLHLSTGSARRFLWLHDTRSMPFPESVATTVDGIFCPSRYHIKLLPEPARALSRVLPNGIDSNAFKDGENKPDMFVYGSAPNRGLRAVLVMWPYIRSEIPSATLEVYYGFSPKFMAWGKMNVHLFDEWMDEMQGLLVQDGVLYKGMVDHETLHDAYARAGFILYPTAFPETGCVSLIKAMAMGAIPITSRFANSTLPELTREWDMGPSEGLSTHVQVPVQDMEWLRGWAEAVVHASKTDAAERDSQRRGEEWREQGWGGVQTRRLAMKATIRNTYGLSEVAKLWAAEMQR